MSKAEHTFIIAEAGVNHNGSMDLARKLIDVASEAGADGVKFQLFHTEKLVSASAPKAEYQKLGDGSESQFEMLRQLELDGAAHKELLAYCQARKIMFLSSAFDLESLEGLHDLGLSMFKIPSGEITNLPYLRKVGSFTQQVLLSTGMANLGEIETALQILEAAGTCRELITVLHCNSAYPTPFEDVNLRAMCTIREAFQVRVGFSDHTPGIVAPIAAVALGAQVIEKHFTLHKGMKGPDHKASLAPEELQAMVRSIRQIEAALGSGIKVPSASEAANLPIVRKSIVALRDIQRGEIFDESNITVKRPGTGISPMEWDRVLGRVAFKNLQADEMITLEL